jgi:hypothetical protein
MKNRLYILLLIAGYSAGAGIAGAALWAVSRGWRLSDNPQDWPVWLSSFASFATFGATVAYVILTYSILRVTSATADAALKQAEAALQQANAANQSVALVRRNWQVEQLQSLARQRLHIDPVFRTLYEWQRSLQGLQREQQRQPVRDQRTIDKLSHFISEFDTSQLPNVPYALTAVPERLTKVISMADDLDRGLWDDEEYWSRLRDLIEFIADRGMILLPALEIFGRQAETIAADDRADISELAAVELRTLRNPVKPK